MRELGQTDTEENNQKALSNCPVNPEMLAELINLIEDGVVSNNVAKELFPEMFASGKSAKELGEGKRFGDEIRWR